MRWLLVFTLLLSLGASALATYGFGDEPVQLPSKARFHLYLLMGQSNMAGRGTIAEDDEDSHPRVLVLNQEDHWVLAAEPLHSDKPIVGVGPGLTFGKTMAEVDVSVTIGLIPCAVGGTPLSAWIKGGDRYQVSIQRAKSAAQRGTIKGVLWHHGENDALKKETAEKYAQRLDSMISDLRNELKSPQLPFVVGELGDFISAKECPYKHIVNTALRSLPDRVAVTARVEANGLSGQDAYHFDADSARELGRRYAHAIQRLQRN